MEFEISKFEKEFSMRRILSCVLVLALSPLVLTSATVQPDPPEPIRVGESKPITMHDATFIVTAETEWETTKRRPKVPIDVQLRITNLDKKDVIFPTFDTIYLLIFDSNGKQIKEGGGRSATNYTRPVLIPGGGSFSLVRKAELRWDEKEKAHELSYWDGTGTVSTFGPLKHGKYSLAFIYSVAPANERILPDKLIRGAKEWNGSLTTGKVTFHILERDP